MKCLVAFDLKRGKLKPEYLGKMNFYLSVLNDTDRIAGENTSIGILLIREKNDTIIEYAFKGLENPMGVATYKLSKELPEQLKEVLPDPQSLKYILNNTEEES